jgi:hypothetical protein
MRRAGSTAAAPVPPRRPRHGRPVSPPPSAFWGLAALIRELAALPPAAKTCAPCAIPYLAVLVKSAARLYTISHNGSAWSGYTQINTSPIASSPAAVSRGPNRLDVFVRGTDDTLYTISWIGNAWSGYTQLGTEKFVSDPGAASQGPNLIDVFVLGTDGNVYKKSWNGSAWSNYKSLQQPTYPQLPGLSECIQLNLENWYGFDLVLDDQCTNDLKNWLIRSSSFR